MKTGVMTSTGEVMIPKDGEESQGWILPMARIVEELGGAVAWDVAEFKIEFPNGKVVKATERGDGLRYVGRQELKWIRHQLVTSHSKGRQAATKVRINKIAEGVDEDEAGDASWIRDKLEEESIQLNHRPGEEMIADDLTKVLPREQLEQFRGGEY